MNTLYALDAERLIRAICPAVPTAASRRQYELAVFNRLRARGLHISFSAVQRWTIRRKIPIKHLIWLAGIAREDGRPLDLAQFVVPKTKT